MTLAPEPLIPKSDADPKAQRLLAGVGEFIRTVIRTGVFLTRPEVTRIITPMAGQPAPSLVWGVLNRVRLTADFDVQLPRILPQYVGQPLEVILLNTSSIATLRPTGLTLDGSRVPLVDGAASKAIDQIGLYILKTDGQDWYVNGRT